VSGRDGRLAVTAVGVMPRVSWARGRRVGSVDGGEGR